METKLAPLVDAIKARKKVTFFLGAGISTSCGIPDFRSPKTGLYSNLKRLNLPYPEAVFDIDYFRENPRAFYTLCEELYPGNFLPSKFHFLLKLFEDKKLLRRVYTQNIDTLERLAGVSAEYIVEAHGSFAANHCIDCSEPMSTEDLKRHMFNKKVGDGIPTCSLCKGYVKPDIVFFGEGLPGRFFDLWDEDLDEVGVAIVAGTSLTVYPFASLPSEVNNKALRVLVNKEVVGDFKKKRKNDIVLQLDCDTVAEALASALGWHKELKELIDSAAAEFAKRKESSDDAEKESGESAEEKAKEIALAVQEAEKENPPHKSPSSQKTPLASPTPTGQSETEDLEKELDKLNI